MDKPVVTVEGKRAWIKTPYGHPAVAKLKALGAHWDRDKRQWWISSGKEGDVRAAIAASGDRPRAEPVTVIGRARHRGRVYFVRWCGWCRTGEHKAHLCSLDERIDFWAPLAQPHETSVTGDGDIAQIVQLYRQPRSLASMRDYLQRQQHQGAAESGPKPDVDCYRAANGEWLTQGCADCAALQRMCPRCRFDVER